MRVWVTEALRTIGNGPAGERVILLAVQAVGLPACLCYSNRVLGSGVAGAPFAWEHCLNRGGGGVGTGSHCLACKPVAEQLKQIKSAQVQVRPVGAELGK